MDILLKLNARVAGAVGAREGTRWLLSGEAVPEPVTLSCAHSGWTVYVSVNLTSMYFVCCAIGH